MRSFAAAIAAPEIRTVPAAFGLPGTDGVITGYASLFERADLAGDVVAPGAFAASLARRGVGGVRLLWQHDPREPIGTWLEIAEDRHGLRVTGRLQLDVARGREAFSLVSAGVLDGLSIGFRTVRAVRERRGAVRRLLEVDLWEISLVTFPMQPDARLVTPAAAGTAPVVRAIRAAARRLDPRLPEHRT
ncbi:HK97 family phage prohead protease [Methylobrevis albus]|uniref:HK97 family phage prohead protease n=1 Tax=Methylobrevis albus TaxID=2793297 RepID=A0A931I2C7_9HYPH|nr:HK97 family phage prohead protease [Methylobrevis albus]MBH0237613.1 HK97 family phage prohead protease [Methylobrevis albus]